MEGCDLLLAVVEVDSTRAVVIQVLEDDFLSAHDGYDVFVDLVGAEVVLVIFMSYY